VILVLILGMGLSAGAQNIPAEAKQHPPHVPTKYDVNRIGNRGVGHGVNVYSLERECAMGKELAEEVDLQSRMVSDPVVTEYINRVAQTLVRNSDAQVPFTVKVVDDDEINAFALPGGFFYVNSGLVLAADNEAELAGVMAHEIAHVAARHATKSATRAEIFNLASIPLVFIGGPAGYAVRQVASLAVPMSFLKFSRDAEREADLLGLEYAYAAGYDPAEFVHFFETLKVREREKISFLAKAFASHPLTEDRIKRVQKEISTFLPPREEYIVSTSEFDEIKARLAKGEERHMINGGTTEKPTLRRRGPEDEPSGDGDRPTLRRR
jgi:predicted Zn-dependent protease